MISKSAILCLALSFVMAAEARHLTPSEYRQLKSSNFRQFDAVRRKLTSRMGMGMGIFPGAPGMDPEGDDDFEGHEMGGPDHGMGLGSAIFDMFNLYFYDFYGMSNCMKVTFPCFDEDFQFINITTMCVNQTGVEDLLKNATSGHEFQYDFFIDPVEVLLGNSTTEQKGKELQLCIFRGLGYVGADNTNFNTTKLSEEINGRAENTKYEDRVKNATATCGSVQDLQIRKYLRCVYNVCETGTQ